MKINLMKKI